MLPNSSEFRLEDVFRTDVHARDEFLSRLFGIFSEEVVRHWCADERSPFENLGRPTIWPSGAARGHTLDFTFRAREGSHAAGTYVGELKCELEFEGYRYLRLTSPDQLAHHGSAAFLAFLQVAKDPELL